MIVKQIAKYLRTVKRRIKQSVTNRSKTMLPIPNTNKFSQLQNYDRSNPQNPHLAYRQNVNHRHNRPVQERSSQTWCVITRP